MKNAVYDKVCGFECSTSTNNNGIFDIVQVGDVHANMNEIHVSSIIGCSNSANGYYPVLHYYGFITCKTVNMSNCQCRQGSALYCAPSVSSSSLSSSLSFCSFTYNKATTSSRCIVFDYVSTNILNQMTYCNVIGNEQATSGSYGIISSYSKLDIYNSSIIKNKGIRI